MEQRLYRRKQMEMEITLIAAEIIVVVKASPSFSLLTVLQGLEMAGTLLTRYNCKWALRSL